MHVDDPVHEIEADETNGKDHSRVLVDIAGRDAEQSVQILLATQQRQRVGRRCHYVQIVIIVSHKFCGIIIGRSSKVFRLRNAQSDVLQYDENCQISTMINNLSGKIGRPLTNRQCVNLFN